MDVYQTIVWLARNLWYPEYVIYPDIDYVNKDDIVVGSGPLSEAWQHGHIYRIARVFIFNSKGEFLLQKRSDIVLAPGKWDNSAAGHVDTGETYLEATLREAREEVGVRDATFREVLKFYTEDLPSHFRISKRFNTLFDTTHDGEVTPDLNEVAATEWIARYKLEDWMQSTPLDFTSDFIHTYELYKKAGH